MNPKTVAVRLTDVTHLTPGYPRVCGTKIHRDDDGPLIGRTGHFPNFCSSFDWCRMTGSYDRMVPSTV